MRASVPVNVGPASEGVVSLGPFDAGVEVLSLRLFVLTAGSGNTMSYAVCAEQPAAAADVAGGDVLSNGEIVIGGLVVSGVTLEFAVGRRMKAGEWIGVVFTTTIAGSTEGFVTARWTTTPREQSQLLWRRPRRS